MDGIGPDSEQIALRQESPAIRVLNLQEGRRSYYYGVSSATTGGLAAFAVPWSVGAALDHVYTHEIGHNMNLRHAPCRDGGPLPGEESADVTTTRGIPAGGLR